MMNLIRKKKRPILAAYHSPLQAILPVGMYRADSFVSTVAAIDQLPAAASNPWSFPVGHPAYYHLSMCFVQTLASTFLLSLLSLAINSNLARQYRNIVLKYGKNVATITLYTGSHV